MLDRAEEAAARQIGTAAGTRPVQFRGAGFVPATGRYAGWIALLLVIALWHSCRRRWRSAARSIGSRSAAHSGTICRTR